MSALLLNALSKALHEQKAECPHKELSVTKFYKDITELTVCYYISYINVSYL